MKKVIITESMFHNLLSYGLIKSLLQDEGDYEPDIRNYLMNLLNRYLKGGQGDTVNNGNNINLGQMQTNGQQQTGQNRARATQVSQNGINMICQFETGKNFGYTMGQKDLVGYIDSNGKRAYGYGLVSHPDGGYLQDKKSVWTQKELEQLYVRTVQNMTAKVLAWEAQNNVNLGQNQLDAMVSACFNFGPGFLQKNICKVIAANQNDPRIVNMWEHLSDKQAAKYPGLKKRRQKEAALYKADMV